MAYRCPTNQNRFAVFATDSKSTNQPNRNTNSAFSASKSVSFAPSTNQSMTSDGFQMPKQYQRNARKRAKFAAKRQQRNTREEIQQRREERQLRAHQLAAEKEKKDAEEKERLDWLNEEDTEAAQANQQQKLAGSAWSKPMAINMADVVDFRHIEQGGEFYQESSSNYNWADIIEENDNVNSSPSNNF